MRGRRSTLEVWRCVFSANCIVRDASSGDNVKNRVAGVGHRESAILRGKSSI